MKKELESKPPKNFFNYRVVLDTDENGHKFYSIRGVHYTNHGKKIEGWDAEPLTMVFDTGDSISGYLDCLSRSATLPVLEVKGDELEVVNEKTAEWVVSRDYWPDKTRV